MTFLTLEQLGERVRALRDQRRLTAEELSGAAGMAVDELAAVEVGARGVAGSELDALAAALGVEPEGLLLAEEPAAPLFRNEGGDEAAARAQAEFAAVMDDFFTFEAAVRR